ncbi:MAG TPA: hypothetical protein VKD24_05900 [Candidatus Angelobacter sp.]|nr:hypothetical protein [Candidatus Angelobacter sp.]
MITWTEKLNALRAVIANECRARFAKHDKSTAGRPLSVQDIAERVLTQHREAVIGGLEDLVNQFVDQWNDDITVRQRLGVRADFDLNRFVKIPAARGFAETLGVPLSYFLRLPYEKCKQALDACCFIAHLQAEESATDAEAKTRQVEILRPVWDVHPDMTFGQALSELKRQTDETIRGLDTESDTGTERSQ